jgi:hypothetical protein
MQIATLPHFAIVSFPQAGHAPLRPGLSPLGTDQGVLHASILFA